MVAIAAAKNFNPNAIGTYPKLIKRCGYMLAFILLVIVAAAAVCGIVCDVLNVNTKKFWKALDKRLEMCYNKIVSKRETKPNKEETQ